MGRLDRRVAVVTGAGLGIGRASALRLGEEGARLALVDLRAEVVRDTREEAAANGLRRPGGRLTGQLQNRFDSVWVRSSTAIAGLTFSTHTPGC
jgi:NAD(P)-dependent dehydrogenase (short-subunit alcohol dehydrogenase family)